MYGYLVEFLSFFVSWQCTTVLIYPFYFQVSEGIPYTLISYVMVLSIGPFMIMITSFDIVSNEIEIGSIRYIISKVHRSSFHPRKIFLIYFWYLSLVSSGIALISLIYQYSAGNAFQFEKYRFVFDFFKPLSGLLHKYFFIHLNAVCKQQNFIYNVCCLSWDFDIFLFTGR